jgi:hypothetical protein
LWRAGALLLERTSHTSPGLHVKSQEIVVLSSDI